MTTTHHSFCRICEALCGLRVTVEDERVTHIEPDPEHVATRGFGCVKGMRQHLMYDAPDRITQPMKRTPTGHVPVSWDEALADIGARVKHTRRVHGSNAVAMYVGTAAGFSVLHPVFAQGFMTGVGSRNMYSSATQDCANKFAVAHHVYGFPFIQPFPDVERTRCLIIVGANPAVSKWSFGQVPNPVQRLKAIEARGGRVFVVDPRRTETAQAAGEHVFIRPGTDVFFFAAFLNALIEAGGVDRDRVDRHMRGLLDVEALARPWTPERAAGVTGVPAETLRAMVHAYLAADGAALYSSTGVNMGGEGALAFWLQEVINAVSGNLDRRGGTLVGHGIIDFAKFGRKHGLLVSETTSRIGGFDAVNDAYPGGLLADEILTPGPGQVRAVFVTGGNPLLTLPNAGRLRAAFERLDLLVTLDLFVNETGTQADYVLPATSPLQRPDLPFLFPLMMGLQTRPYLQATRAVVPPRGGQRDEMAIYLDLARACGTPIFGSRAAQAAFDGLRRARPRSYQQAALSLLLRLCGQGGFAALAKHPHGKPMPDHRGGDFLGARVVTADGRVDLAPAPLLAQARERLEARFERERAHTGLKLITRRAITSHNSWTHNHERFVRGRRGTNYLYMHPRDAEAAGLSEGDLADVETPTAAVRLPVALLDTLMPGAVALPHGWGHQVAEGLRVARRTRGVNVNLLAADGPEALEPLSGMAHLTGVPVEVRPAAGPQNTESWSGR